MICLLMESVWNKFRTNRYLAISLWNIGTIWDGEEQWNLPWLRIFHAPLILAQIIQAGCLSFHLGESQFERHLITIIAVDAAYLLFFWLVWNLNNLLLKWIIESYSSLMLYKNNWLIHVVRSIHSRLMSNCTKCIVSCVNACMYPETLSRNTEQERNQDATFQVHEIDVNCERF